MKVAFIDNAGLAYTPDTPYQQPLGGIQSAVCYLAEALVLQGVECTILNGIDAQQSIRGVQVCSIQQFSIEHLLSCDLWVAVGSANLGPQLRAMAGAEKNIVLWTGHAHDQEAVQVLADPGVSQSYSGFVFVSEWQQHCFQQQFTIAQPCYVLRNGLSEPFVRLLELPINHPKPVLAYTSTPFRGLELLLKAFPDIKRQIPEVQLRVYSSMKVYGVAEEQDQFQSLYDQAQAMHGVDYIGSLSQSALAEAMQEVSVLAYPNTFEETSCIAVIEAMAAGCQVVTSALGALPETTHGFAQLIPVTGDWRSYQQRFVRATIGALKQEDEERLELQQQWISEQYVWSHIAAQWRQTFS